MRRQKSKLAKTALCVALILAVMPAVAANRTNVAQHQRREITRIAFANIGNTVDDAGLFGTATPMASRSGAQVAASPAKAAVGTIVVKKQAVPFRTIRRTARLLRPGVVRTLQQGVPGVKECSYQVVYKNGAVVSKKLLRAQITTSPRDKIILIGYAGLASRGSFIDRSSLTMHATAYDPSPRCCGKGATGRTSIGMKAGYGIVAVDPRCIPLRTRLFIEGYGFAVAGDTGGAIKGKRIDLGFNSYSAAVRFGRKHVKVHVLK